MRIRTQFIITMALFALVLLGIAVSLIMTNRQVGWLRQQERIALNIERGVGELSYLSNDYLLYHEIQQRVRWESKFSLVSQDVSRLEPRTPEQQALVNSIEANQERLRAVFASVVSTLEGGATKLDSAIEMTVIQVPWSRMGVQHQSMLFDAHLLTQEFRDEIDRLAQTNNVLIVALLGLLGAYFAANYSLVYRNTLRSVSELQIGTGIVGSGNLDFTIPIRNSDEIGELSRAFNRMTANLKSVTASKADLEREIAERKRAQERISRLNHELETQAEELQQMNQQLEEALAEEKVAREEAETGRNILESLMQYAPAGIAIGQAPDGRIRMASQYARQLAGSRVPRLTGSGGQACAARQVLFGPDGTTPVAAEQMPITRAARDGEVVINQEMMLCRDDGKWLTILSSAAPIRDRDGKITGAITVWGDITDRKRMEREIVKLNLDLERRAQELELANRELESFSYSISHDLRTPLVGIHNFAAIVLQEHGAQIPLEARRFVELIRDNSAELNGLVEGLLAFSRSTRQPLEKQTVDLGQVARLALNDLRAQQEGRCVEITIGDMPAGQADPILIKQVLANLLSNAFKFTRTREVAKIEVGSWRLKIGDTMPGIGPSAGRGQTPGIHPPIPDPQSPVSYVVYYVRDNGVGFEPDQAGKVFGVFQRLHGQEEYEGAGVGLAIVERIIHRHGGRVSVQAQVDQGATFFFTLPDG